MGDSTKGNELPIQITACVELKSVTSMMEDYIFYVMSFIVFCKKANYSKVKYISGCAGRWRRGLTAKGLEELGDYEMLWTIIVFYIITLYSCQNSHNCML